MIKGIVSSILYVAQITSSSYITINAQTVSVSGLCILDSSYMHAHHFNVAIASSFFGKCVPNEVPIG